MLNFVNDNTQFAVTFTAYEIVSICQTLNNIKMVSRDYDIIHLCTSLLSAFSRSLNN